MGAQGERREELKMLKEVNRQGTGKLEGFVHHDEKKMDQEFSLMPAARTWVRSQLEGNQLMYFDERVTLNRITCMFLSFDQ